MIDLSSNLLKSHFAKTGSTESDVLAHILAMLPGKPSPSSADLFGRLDSGVLRRTVAAHRAGYVLLSATQRHWNCLVHSFMRCQSETLEKHSKTWESMGIDLFSATGESFPEVLQQLDAMTKGELQQSEWQAVYDDLRAIVGDDHPESEGKLTLILDLACAMCSSIIQSGAETREHALGLGHQKRLRELRELFPSFIQSVKQNGRNSERALRDNLWPLTKEMWALLQDSGADALDTFDTLITEITTENEESVHYLNRTALAGKFNALKNGSSGDRLVATLHELIESAVNEALVAEGDAVTRLSTGFTWTGAAAGSHGAERRRFGQPGRTPLGSHQRNRAYALRGRTPSHA